MNTKNIIIIFLGFLLLACLASCTNELFEEDCHNSNTYSSEVYVQSMKVSFSKPFFDSSNNTRAAVSEEWKDGDILYLRFQNENSYIQGKAIYKVSDNNWTVTYKGELPIDKECSLQVWYFDGETSEEGNDVTLSAETGLYSDNNGFYLYNSAKELTCVACLKPASSRLRFLGSSGSKISIEGLCTFKYNLTNGTLIHYPISSINLTVQSTGSTPYIYVAKDENNGELCVSDTRNDFCMTMNEDFLKNTGSSGYINIPTSSNYEGWEVYDHHDYIDLGLPSGTLWATCNVGADNPEDFGNYYAWGEIETKSTYWYDNYKWGDTHNYTKYVCHGENGLNYFTDNKTKLEPEDDVANVLWKRGWHIPDDKQFKEMVENCRWNFTTVNGIYVFVGVSKLNGNEIILPATDCFTYKQFVFPGDYSIHALYWTCDLSDSQYQNAGIAYSFWNNSLDDIRKQLDDRSCGVTVRPVKQKILSMNI